MVDLSAANKLPPRADDLFRIFARFEFALKMAGLAKMRGSMVVVKWDEFAECKVVGEPFVDKLRQEGVCPLLFAKPPQTEIVSDGRYDFEVVDPPTTATELFGAVRRVRNNLFHGGKYFDDDRDRNEQLVAEAIAVLLLAVVRRDDVLYFFEGRV